MVIISFHHFVALICSACTPPHLYGLPPRLGQPNAHAERNQRRRLCRLPAANSFDRFSDDMRIRTASQLLPSSGGK